MATGLQVTECICILFDLLNILDVN